MRLRIKISLFAIFLVILVTVGTSISIFLYEKKFLLNELKESQVALIGGLEEVCEESILTDNELLLFSYMKKLKKTRGIIYIMFINNEAKIVAHTDTTKIGKLITDENDRKSIAVTSFFSQTYIDSNNMEISSIALPVMTKVGQRLGSAQIGFSVKVLDQIVKETLNKMRARIFGISGVFLLIGILGSFFLSHLITHPIKKLHEGARHIGEGELDYRVAVKTKDEIGDLSKQFNVMAEKLKELDQMKDDFVTSVSHELRSPLSAIESYLNFILQDKETKEKFKVSINEIKDNTARLNRFVNDILDISKIEAQKMALKIEPVEILNDICEVISLFKPKLNEKKIAIESMLPEKLPVVLADKDKVRQIITNLISNAIKFTSEEGKVTISAAETGEFLEISVTDTGFGIPPDEVDKIFDKFHQVKNVRDKIKGPKGTGLGLSIIKGIVESHKGKIWVESELGKGSTFHFTLQKTGDNKNV